MAEAGIGVYVGGGGSGEAYTLRGEEPRRVLEIAVEELKGRVPVRAMGVEPRTPEEMIRYGDLAAKAGVDALQVYSLDMGHGFTPKRAEMMSYYRAVLDQISLPVVLSTHQSVGYLLPEDLILELQAHYPQIVGVNCTSPDIVYLTRLVDQLPEGIDVHVGGPMQALTALALGASGYLSSEANVAPQLAVEVVSQWADGRFDQAHAAYARLIRLFGLLTRAGGISATKAVLASRGLPGGIPRPPRLPLSAPETEALAQNVDRLGVIL